MLFGVGNDVRRSSFRATACTLANCTRKEIRFHEIVYRSEVVDALRTKVLLENFTKTRDSARAVTRDETRVRAKKIDRLLTIEISPTTFRVN